MELCFHTEPIYSPGDSRAQHGEDGTRDTSGSPPGSMGGSACATQSTATTDTLSGGEMHDMPETKAFLLFYFHPPHFSPSLHQGSKWRAPCSVTEGSEIAVISMQPKRHSAIQLNQGKLTSQPWRSCSSPVQEKIILEPCLLCKGEKAWESPHCLSGLPRSVQLEI